MPVIPISINGQTYQSRTNPLSVQNCVNMYMEIEPSGSSPAALMSWPGKKAFSTGAGANRGVYRKEWYSSVYAVNGTTLYKISASGGQTSLGTIAGSGRCVFESDDDYLYIVTGGLVYRTDGTTLAQVTDPNLESPNSIAYLNQQMIYDGSFDKFWVTDAGDGGTLNSLNFAFAQSSGDELIRVYSFRQQIIMFGSDSLEPWYNSGVGNPPMDRIEGGLRAVGIAGVYCVTNTPQAVYFLGHDRTVYRLDGYEPVPVSTVAINNAIENYSTVSDCFAYSLKLQGQNFVIFSFPTANKTWCFSQETGIWLELSSGVTGGRDLANGYCYAFGKNLVTDYQNGNVYELDIDTFDDNAGALIRERTSAPVYSGQAAQSDKEVFYNYVKMIVNSGDAIATGQGSDPQVMLSYSDNGGRSWSAENWRSLGAMGEYKKELYWHALGASKDRVFKVRFSDPVAFHILRMEADVEVGV